MNTEPSGPRDSSGVERDRRSDNSEASPLSKMLGRLGSLRAAVDARARLLFGGHSDFASGGIKEVPVESLRPSPYQPRSRFDEREMEELAKNISENGLLHPPNVRRIDNKTYELLEGERRWRVAKQLGWSRIEVRVREQVTDRQAQILALAENIGRSDLTAWEKARGIASLRVTLEAEGEDATQKRLSELTGCSAGAVSNSLAIAERLTDRVLEAASADLQSLNKLPETALLGASRPSDIAERAKLVKRAVAAQRKGEAPGRAVAAAKPGRPRAPFTVATPASGRLSFRLRTPVQDLTPHDARAALARLRVIVEALETQAGEDSGV